MASFVRPDKLPEPAPRLSKWEKADIRTERRSRLSKHELIREDIADKLRCPLCFCLPCVVVLFILLVLIGIYVVQPYVKGKDLISTQCRVNRTEISDVGSCSHRTDQFGPCYKIIVNCNASETPEIEAILMENEQAMIHCEKCSFTFGSSDLFGRQSTCSWNSDLTAGECSTKYIEYYGKPNSTYPCFYNPDNTNDVVRTLKVTQSEAVSLILIPLLFLLLWIFAIVFVMYDRQLRSNIDEQIVQERHQPKSYLPEKGAIMNGGTLPLGKHPGINLETATVASADSTAASVDTNATPHTRRRRKKKMPCAKSHYQFNYLDEGMLMEDKPLSTIPDHPLSYSQFITVDTSPNCTCHHTGFMEAGFDILPQRDYFSPFASTPNRNSRYSNQQVLICLPESFV